MAEWPEGEALHCTGSRPLNPPLFTNPRALRDRDSRPSVEFPSRSWRFYHQLSIHNYRHHVLWLSYVFNAT
ncbi:hypothetical protein FVEG_08050 [Fusarium verticillioides 7600]|uniref:Uncharacterized protein n=1 Tax=Gibberella moniliformis (strain M3125 / FGSC 7600) TaxID=334819 RepID=W7MAZ9_GIBM7|nr:hypothetical protein FVEG_08050 [Fusarium verticillioides 7600]EWG48186.1 hypothetical protein FVEG_08050 [Fusarium verticillioides 7600]